MRWMKAGMRRQPMRSGWAAARGRLPHCLFTFALASSCAPTVNGHREPVGSMAGAATAGQLRNRGFRIASTRWKARNTCIHRKSRQDLVSGTARACAGAVIGNSCHAVGHGGPPPALVNCECGTAFPLGQGRVAAADFRGNDCAAVRPARRLMRPPAPRFPCFSAPAAL